MGSPEYSRRQAAGIRCDADSQRYVEFECMRHLAGCWSGTTGGERTAAEEAIRALRADAFSTSALETQHKLALELLDNGKTPDFGAISFACRRDESLLKRCGGWDAIGDAWLISPVAHEHLGQGNVDNSTTKVLASFVEWLNAEASVRAKATAYAQASAAVMRGEDPSLYVDAIDESEVDPDDDGKSFGQLIAGTMLEVLASADDAARVALLTYFAELDEHMGGLVPGSMHVIGGRPGDGKSSVGIAAQKAWAMRGIRSVMISCEDPERVVGTRVTASVTLKPQRDFLAVRRGAPFESMQAADREQRNTNWELAKVVFRIGPKIDRVLRAMTRAVRNGGAEVLIVDYLQAIHGDRSQDRHHEIRRIAASIKQHAARLGVPVVLTSQLKRRQGKRPTLSDLRDAGEIEEMAENVILLWRDGEDRHAQRWAELAKAKSGPAGTTYRIDWHPEAACVLDFREAAFEEPRDTQQRRNGFRDD